MENESSTKKENRKNLFNHSAVFFFPLDKNVVDSLLLTDSYAI